MSNETLYEEYPEYNTETNDKKLEIKLESDSTKIITYSVFSSIIMVLLSIEVYGLIFKKTSLIKDYIYNYPKDIYLVLIITLILFLANLFNELSNKDEDLYNNSMIIDTVSNITFLGLLMFLFVTFNNNENKSSIWFLSNFIWGIGIISLTYITDEKFKNLKNNSKIPIITTSLVVLLLSTYIYFFKYKNININSKYPYIFLGIVCILMFILGISTDFLDMNESKKNLGYGLILFMYTIFLASFYDKVEKEFQNGFKLLLFIMFGISIVLLIIKNSKPEYDFLLDYNNIWSNTEDYELTPIVKNITKVDWNETNDVKINLLIDLRELENKDENLINCSNDWNIKYEKSSESIVFNYGVETVKLSIKDSIKTITFPDNFNSNICKQSCKNM
jgi:hypothetical protein